jgi:uncharacterized protein (TIGR02996 family)
VRAHLDRRFRADAVSLAGDTPLHQAAIHGHLQVCRLLLQRGANPEAPDRGAWTPLHHAAAAGHGPVIDLLLREGVDPTGIHGHPSVADKMERALESWATRRELERAIRRDLDDPAPYAVYADWMLERGELLGQLASVQLSGDEDAAAAFLKRHALRFLGPAENGVTCSWLGGFVSDVRLRTESWEVERTGDRLLFLLSRRVTQFLRSLTLESVAHTASCIVSIARARELRRLTLVMPDGPLGSVWDEVPALEELTLTARDSVRLGKMRLPHLRRLVVRFPVDEEVVDDLAGAQLLGLERLRFETPLSRRHFERLTAVHGACVVAPGLGRG